LLAACEQGPPQLPWATKIALATAMRASEIRRLERRHIHLDNGFVHLPKTTNGDKRDVPPVLPGAADVMAEAMQTLPVRADGYLFGHPDKLGSEGGYTQSMLTASFADAVDRAALADDEFRNLNADFRFHDARHVATTRLAPLHRDALDLAKTTGHKTLSVLMRFYNEKPEDCAARLRQVAWDLRNFARGGTGGREPSPSWRSPRFCGL
jgi:integrase